MNEPSSFDFWYAVQNTELLRMPTKQLSTFGTTQIRYFLITELLDSVDQVRVREGQLEAAQPQILTPQHFQQAPIDGFDDEESANYMTWLKENAPNLRFLQYGFTISKQEIKDELLSENLAQVEANVMKAVEDRDEAFCAVIRGVEQPWEVCLLKLMVDLVESNIGQHVNEMQQRNLLPNPNAGAQEIEQDFAMAQQDHSRIPYLHKKLQQKGVFSQYEDRFYALVKSAKGLL